MRRIVVFGFGLLAPALVSLAAADSFRASMVEAGVATAGAHVDFSPRFPAPPLVTLAPRQVATSGDAPQVCSPEAGNITAAGFDYSVKCNFAVQPDAVWIAILLQ